MNLGEMIRQVIRDNEDDPEYNDVKDWINRALDDLSPIASIQERKTTSIITANYYAIPDDCRKIEYVFAAGEELYAIPQRDLESSGYKLWGKEIIVQNGPESGDLEIYYTRNITKLENDDDELEIESEFHDLPVLYATAMYQYMDDEPGRENDSLQRYYQRKEEYQRFKRISEPPHAIKDVYSS